MKSCHTLHLKHCLHVTLETLITLLTIENIIKTYFVTFILSVTGTAFSILEMFHFLKMHHPILLISVVCQCRLWLEGDSLQDTELLIVSSLISHIYWHSIRYWNRRWRTVEEGSQRIPKVTRIWSGWDFGLFRLWY